MAIALTSGSITCAAPPSGTTLSACCDLLPLLNDSWQAPSDHTPAPPHTYSGTCSSRHVCRRTVLANRRKQAWRLQ
jgi:hypothetical protein